MSDAQMPSLFPSGPSQMQSQTQMQQARELFFAEGREPNAWVQPHIARSWLRCREADPALADSAPAPQAQWRDRREQSTALLACAQAELDFLTEHALGLGCVVILSDAQGMILEEIGSPDFLPKAQRVALTPGVVWSEASRGTNAIGTALLERQALMVLGGEHYLPQNGVLGCAAAPIFTGRGELAGALDISGEAVHVNSHALGLVRLAAQQVEHRMMLAHARGGHLLRFHRRPGLLGTAREGLVAIEDGRVVAANRVALTLLGEPWDGLLDQPIERLTGLRWTSLQKQAGLLTLPSGQQIAAMVEPTARRTYGPAARAPARAAEAEAEASADPTAPLLARAARVLDQGVPVLVTGETGSGKEVFARGLHAASRRRAGPFVAVNCAALPETLIEAELFGYEEGAFTGARRRGMPGRIREADGGVLFLDEIGDMPLGLQTRLLRVLEDRVVSALGGGRGVAVDFDLVCATHRDLKAMVAAGSFRADLLYRVSGFGAALPALRDRADRRPLIARLFDQAGGTARRLRLADEALDCLAAQPWPGNVRELLSVLRCLVALADDGDTLGVEHLPRELTALPADSAATMQAAEPLADMARHAIDRVLAECDGQVGEAARRLGVHRSTVYRHLSRQNAGG